MTSSTKKKKYGNRIKNAILRSKTVLNNKHPHPTESNRSKDVDVIRLVDPRDGGNLEVMCSCGWEYGPDENPLNLGRQAHEHSKETGHVMRGRG